MASIQQTGRSFRAVIRRKDFYVAKSFRDRTAAETWAEEVERGYLAAKARNAILSADQFIAASAHEAEAALKELAPVQLQRLFALPSLAEISVAANPAQCTGVYFLFNQDELVYVGQSENVYGRLAAHLAGEKDFDRFAVVTCPRNLLNAIEKHYIAELNPKHNKRGVTVFDVPGVGRVRLNS